VFRDDFDSLDFSPDRVGKHTWYEGVWFNQRHAPISNISVSGSVLSLKWQSTQQSSDTSITSYSNTEHYGQHWRYGYFEARMKWNVVPGAWPAVWLIPVEDAEGRSTYNGRRESGEIDIFEGQGDRPHTYFGTIHDWVNLESTANENNHFALPDSVDFSQFHVYGVLWTPGTVAWYLDDHLLHSEKTPAIFDQQSFFLVLSMQQGLNWKRGDGSARTRSDLVLNVDWVRVWQK
jgi:beta-glucanase (GH16 family)